MSPVLCADAAAWCSVKEPGASGGGRGRCAGVGGGKWVRSMEEVVEQRG